MAGGINDSSLTRVQPVFSSLAQRGDPSWVLRLLRLGSRASVIGLPAELGRPKDPKFEYSCQAPEDLLRWMVTNPDRLDWSKLEASKLSPGTLEKRQALRDGDVHVMQEALTLLEKKGRRPGAGQWHVLEGETKVDCALLGDDVSVFIEGKRTEPYLTESVSWLRERDQVVRNLDCLRVERGRAAHWFVLLVVEEGSTTEADARRLDLGERVRAALPHLSADEVEEVWRHYAGYTTWAAIHREFVD